MKSAVFGRTVIITPRDVEAHIQSRAKDRVGRILIATTTLCGLQNETAAESSVRNHRFGERQVQKVDESDHCLT
jgi:hypothetical protein